jgi:tRNA G18 (ribose-2'-O)-methylase SpoU
MNKKLKLWELNRKTEAEFREQKKFPLVVVLDDIRSLNNIGSFFRTGDAFNIEKMFLCGITAVPPHRDIHKTALGATDTVDWEYKKQTIDCVLDLKKQGYEVCVIEQTSETTLLQEVAQLAIKPVVLVFGNEVNGVAQEVIDVADRIIEIPQFGTKHSLNVSVCAGVVMWEFCKKHIQ